MHFLEKGWTIDEVPLESIVKKGRVIPLTDAEPNSLITADMILASGVDFDGSVIPVLHTGWTDRAWGSQRFWNDMIGMDESVSHLMIERGVSAVAIDFFLKSPFGTWTSCRKSRASITAYYSETRSSSFKC